MDVYNFKRTKHSVKTKNVLPLLFLVLTFGLCYATNEVSEPVNNKLKDKVTVQQADKSMSVPAKPVSTLINDIQVHSLNMDTIEIKLIFSDNPMAQYFILRNPTRLVVDIAHGQLKNAIHSEVFNGTLIKDLRQGEQPNQALRLVFDMNNDVNVSESTVDPKMIVFQLKNKSPQAIKAVLPPAVSETDKAPLVTANKTKKPVVCSAGSVSIDDMQVNSLDAGSSQIKLLFSGNPKVHSFTLGNPMRFIVDIDRGCLQNAIDPQIFNGTLIQGLREGKQANQVLRLVFDMNSEISASQSVIDAKTVVFDIKSKIPKVSSVPPVVINTDKPLPTIVSTAKETPVATNMETSSDTQATKGVSTSVQQDSMLLVVGQLKSFYTLGEEQAVALELDGGPRVFRGNGTYAYALNDNNRVKLTGEYLREDLDFEFYTGDTRQWVQQDAIGAAYEYLLGDGEGIFKNIDIDSHYSHAQSKDLSTKTIEYPDGSTLTDYRRIAGGNDLNANMEVGMELWADGIVTLGPDYDRVRYDTEYEYQDGHDAQGFGGHVRLDQKLKNNLDLQLNSTVSQLFETYGLGLNWLWSSNQKMAMTAGIASSYTKDFTTERNFWINGVNVSVVWDAPESQKSSVSPSKFNSSESLSQWVQTPAVRMPDVLAISDERIITNNPFVSVTGVCPSGATVVYSGGQYSAAGNWYQSYLQQATIPPANYIALDSANIITSPSGQVACLYSLNSGPPGFSPLGNLILENATYQHAVGANQNWQPNSASAFWPATEPPPAISCIGSSPARCPFQTVAP